MTEPDSMGAYLRAARRRRRVGIERAAEETRIRADFLARMEADEFDFLAPAYVRGFLKAYARYLGLDPAPIVEEFDGRFGVSGGDTSQLLALRERTQRNHAPARRSFSSWSVAAVLAATALLALAIVGLMNPEEPAVGPRTERVASDRPASPQTTRSATPSPTEPPKRKPSPRETLAAADGIKLEIVATTGRCWVQVDRDGGSTPIFSDTLEIGQSKAFTADEEMTVVLGYPAGVELVLNGRNLGSPGTANPLTLNLPEDIDAI